MKKRKIIILAVCLALVVTSIVLFAAGGVNYAEGTSFEASIASIKYGQAIESRMRAEMIYGENDWRVIQYLMEEREYRNEALPYYDLEENGIIELSVAGACLALAIAIAVVCKVKAKKAAKRQEETPTVS